jgi:hypothetical protein
MFEWSPTLKRAVQACRYWELRLKCFNYPATSTTRLSTYRSEGGITEDTCTTQREIKQQLALAKPVLKQYQKKHQEL